MWFVPERGNTFVNHFESIVENKIFTSAHSGNDLRAAFSKNLQRLAIYLVVHEDECSVIPLAKRGGSGIQVSRKKL